LTLSRRSWNGFANSSRICLVEECRLESFARRRGKFLTALSPRFSIRFAAAIASGRCSNWNERRSHDSLEKIWLVDFSEPSKKAVNYALSLALQFDARLFLAHIVSNDAADMEGEGGSAGANSAGLPRTSRFRNHVKSGRSAANLSASLKTEIDLGVMAPAVDLILNACCWDPSRIAC
jgi:hypothetical protein